MSEQADIEAALARATAAYKNVCADRDALKDAADRAEAAEAENERLRDALGDRLREALGENLFDVLRERDRLREALKPFADYASLSGFDKLPDEMPMTQGSVMAAKQITVADFRRAKEAGK